MSRAPTSTAWPVTRRSARSTSLLIDKVSGRVAYAVMSLGRFLGLGHSHYPIPWSALKYDAARDGYATNITEKRLKDAYRRSATTRGPIAAGKRKSRRALRRAHVLGLRASAALLYSRRQTNQQPARISPGRAGA